MVESTQILPKKKAPKNRKPAPMFKINGMMCLPVATGEGSVICDTSSIGCGDQKKIEQCGRAYHEMTKRAFSRE